MFETRQALKGAGWVIGSVLLVWLPHSEVKGQCVPPPSGLLAWWDADSVTGTTANDIQGVNDGTLVNGASTVPGFVGQAFSFDGVDDHIDLPNIGISGSNPFTIDAWIFPSCGCTSGGIGPGGFKTILDFGENFNFQSVGVYYCSATGVKTNTLSFCGFGFCFSAPSNSITPNAWNHVAATYSGGSVSTGGKLYINGQLQTLTNDQGPDGTLSIHNLNYGIGYTRRLPGPSFQDLHFPGLIDEVDIYNRALSASEILAIFNAGSAGKCIDSDGDGVDDADDACPDSDLSPTIIINGQDTGVANEPLGDGCTISDLIGEVLAIDPSTADVVQFLVDLKGEGIISGQEMGGILQSLHSP